MNFLDFVKNKQYMAESLTYVNEAFQTKDFTKAMQLINSNLRKNIKVGEGGRLLNLKWYDLNVGGQDCQSYYYVVGEKGAKFPKSFSINWLKSGNSTAPYSVSFFDAENTNKILWNYEKGQDAAKANLTINFKGASIVYYLPVIAYVINNNAWDLGEEDAKKEGRKVFDKKNESVNYDFWLGAQNYKIMEGISESKLSDIYHASLGHKYELVNESYIWVNENELEDRKKEVYGKVKAARDAGDKDAEKMFYKEYRNILNAIKGGATSIDDLECAVSHNQTVKVNYGKETTQAEQKVEKEKKDPKRAFKEMDIYINTVLKGLQPGVILCGAPGLGKTYRTKQHLLAKKLRNGIDFYTLKGKCTPRALYVAMYNYQKKGQYIIVDDADSVVGPKASEDAINLLKAALDSTSDDEGRLVSYNVSGDIKDEDGEPIPHRFYYNGGMIVITNYSIGQIDTAVKGRVFVQSLDFTAKQILDLIEEMLPVLGDGKISDANKKKGFNYLKELAEEMPQMELSFRTFLTCGRIFEATEDDGGDEYAKSMIKDQMEGQFARGGKKF